jgi:hypothetical protein
MSKNDETVLIFSNKTFIEEEIKKVYSPKLQEFLRECVKDFPEYFWTAPASLEKYHYPDERVKGGLVLHVRRTCRLTETIVNFHELNMWERDVLLASCILHDSFARGVPPVVKGYSDPYHPIYPTERFPFNGYADRFIDKKIYDEIMECVISHLGRFSLNQILNSKKKLATIFQLIDHVASRDFVRVDV